MTAVRQQPDSLTDDQPALPVPWPVVHADTLLCGNPASPVAVCSLWTETKRVAKLLDPACYSVIGNLYRHRGVNALIRNILANPRIRHLYLWGNDLSETGDTLAAFFAQGLCEGMIRGTNVAIEPELPPAAVELVRQQVRFVDLRGLPAEQLQAAVSRAAWLPPFAEASYYPLLRPETESMAAEASGYRVVGETVAQAWIKLVNQVMRYGQVKRNPTSSSDEIKELYNVVAVVTAENPDEPFIPPYIASIPDAPTTAENIKRYYGDILSGTGAEGVSYTYGQRLRNYPGGIDQVAEMIAAARQRPHSRRMFATTWAVAVDGASGEPPCLTQVLGSVREGRFYLTAHFRSHDCYKAWVKNTFALRALQQLVAGEAGLAMGWLTVISHSAHIYASDWLAADTTLESSYATSLKRGRKGQYDLDPRGYFIIKIEGSEIVATLHDYADRPLHTFRADKARKLVVELADGGWLSQPGHALYLGTEFQKAEIALTLGLAYRQDRSLPLAERAGGDDAVPD